MIVTQFKHLVQPLGEFIKSLITQRGEKVEIINQVANKHNILLSKADMGNPAIFKNNAMPVESYINDVLIPKAIDEINHQNNEEDIILKCFEEFETNIIDQLKNTKNLMMELLFEINRRKASNFISDFSNGVFMDKNKFTISLGDAIVYATISSEAKASKINRISQLVTKFNQPFRDIDNGIILEKKIMSMSEWAAPKLFEQIDQVEINKTIAVPCTNGIDIHPTKNLYVAMGCYDGDLVIIDQDTNKEINRIKLNNNSSGATQSCLWDPSGNKIMVSTYENHSIYIYDKTGQKLLKSIEKTYSENGFGAIWLSKQEVAVGYYDGMVKFFNIDEGREIRSIKVNAECAWGMDCVNDSHLLVGDFSGSITNIDWKNNKIDWKKTGWHLNNNHTSCLRLNQDKTKLLTGSYDRFVKMMNMQDQSKLWEFRLDNCVMGISWVPSELYALALSHSNQLVALNLNDGTKIIEFNGLSKNPMTLRVNSITAEVLAGDTNGTIRKLKITQV